MKELAVIFAIDVCGFAILDNHLHVLVRLDLARAKAWIAGRAGDAEWVEQRRRRLMDLGWFMKSLKEPIARRANQDDKCTGAFWDGRFRSVAILDEASLLATCAYIDLNPVAAGIAATPEKSPHTSFKARIDHCATQGHLETLRGESRHASKTNVEKGLWLFPIEDRRDQNGHGLAGMLHDISLSGYAQLIDWSSRLIRPGKVNLSAHIPDILTRLQIDAGSWKSTLEKLIGAKKYVGTYFGNTARLEEAAAHRGIKFLKNVTGRETPLTSSQVG